jgi:hypothetical protein
MLLPADAALARRDTALPGLATLLDPERLATRLLQVTGARIEHVRLLQVRYKPGTSCLASLQLELHGRAVDVHAKALRPSERHVLDKTRAAAGDSNGFFGMKLALEPELIDIAVFPTDRRLPVLTAFGDEARRRDIVGRLFPDDAQWQDATLTRIAYRPEWRWTGKLADTHGRYAAVKLYAAAGFESALAAATRLPPLKNVVLPQLLGASPRHGVLAFAWQDGAPLTMTSPGSTADRAALYALGAALAELHAQRGSALPPRSPDAEGAKLLDAARQVSALCPPLSATAFVLARELGQRLSEEAPKKQRALHGNLQPRHILLRADGRIGLLDCDRAACGDPALDLGSLIAHWERDVASGTLQDEMLHTRRDLLLTGYRDATPGTAARVHLYTAAALFSLAPQLFERRAPNWSDDMARALFRCEALIRRLDKAPAPITLEARHALSA